MVWPFSNREWCCSLFSEALRNTETRGSCIQVVAPDGVLPMGFFMVFRAIDASDEAEFAKSAPDGSIGVVPICRLSRGQSDQRRDSESHPVRPRTCRIGHLRL